MKIPKNKELHQKNLTWTSKRQQVAVARAYLGVREPKTGTNGTFQMAFYVLLESTRW